MVLYGMIWKAIDRADAETIAARSGGIVVAPENPGDSWGVFHEASADVRSELKAFGWLRRLEIQA